MATKNTDQVTRWLEELPRLRALATYYSDNEAYHNSSLITSIREGLRTRIEAIENALRREKIDF